MILFAYGAGVLSGFFIMLALAGLAFRHVKNHPEMVVRTIMRNVSRHAHHDSGNESGTDS